MDDLDDQQTSSSNRFNSNNNMNSNYESLDDFMDSVCSKDTNIRLDVYARLEDYLKNTNTCLDCGDLMKFCESILQWVNSSNYRISINGLTIIQLLIQRLTEQLKCHTTEIVNNVVDRLADSKEQVRVASNNILIFMMACYTPNFIWEKLINGFNHKLPKVREELLGLLSDTLNKFGASNLPLNKIVTHIVRLLTDANQLVRDKSLELLVEVYCHVGERLRNDLRKKQLPEAKLKLIFSKFDEASRNGDLKDEAKQSSKNDLAETSSASCASLPPTSQKPQQKMIPSSRSNMASLSQMASSSTGGGSNRPGSGSSNLPIRIPRSSSLARSTHNLKTGSSLSTNGGVYLNASSSRHNRTASAAAPSFGGIDEDAFINAFEAVPKIQIYSAKDLDQHMSQINDCLSDLNNDWEKRVDSLKRIRSLAIACSNQYDDEFFTALRTLSVSFTNQVKDLRSQIVREACITIAYLSQTIGHRLEPFVEVAMSHLINLIQNSAKVMASSGIIAIRFIIEYTHSSRLIPLIAGGVSSRSKEIRRYCCEFLNQLLQTWETHHFEKNIQLIQTCIKKGIQDADQEARVSSRKAFWSFSSHYPNTADNLLQTLDAKTQKLLQNGSQGAFGSVKSLKDGYLSINSASNHNNGVTNYQQMNAINYDFMDSQNNRLNKQQSTTTTNNNSNGASSSGHHSTHQQQQQHQTNTQAMPSSRIKRSTSAVDIKNPRSTSVISTTRQIANNNAGALGTGDSTNSRHTSTTATTANTSTTTTTSRIPMSISQPQKNTSLLGTSRIAHSQPGSRSTSPTPKFSYLTHNNGLITSPILSNNVNLNNSENNTNNNNNNNNLINNDLAASASTPSGYTNGNGLVKTNGSGFSGSRSANVSATKSKIPTSSRNSSRESSPGRRSNYGGDRRTSLSKTPGRRLFGRQLTNNSDSEQALATAITNKYTRSARRWEDSDEASETSSMCSERSFSSSIGGTRVTEVRDMNEAITCLSSSQWSDRRDGLVNLRNMMQINRIFSRQELKRLCEIFSRLFQDPHVKVFTLFLDTLNDFIRLYKRDLKEWLYVLLTRLLTKLGSESLSSVYQKLCLCLEATRSSFDLDLQFKILIQFIKENTGQTSNLKVKVAVLKYLQDIICLMEAVDFHTTDDLKYAVCKIVSLTAEPKSVDIRKTAQAVLVALFNLNTPEFSMLLAELPKNIQETASRILRNHMKNFSQENGNGSGSYTQYSSEYRFKSSSSYFNDYVNSMGNVSSNDDSLNSGSQLSHVIKDIQNLNMNNNNHYHYLAHKDRLNGNGGLINKTELNTKLLDTLSKDSGVQSNGDVDSDSDGAMTSSSTTTTSSTANLPNINYIIGSLSSNSSSISLVERLKSMKDLTELIKAGNRPECRWNENFKNILFCLFNHLDTSTNENNNNDQTLILQTLVALRELLQFQYKEFANYIELTIMKLIEKYKDSPPNELSKLVEEVIFTAARCLPPEPCARVLKPLIETAEYPKNLIAIRMMQKTIDQMNLEMCTKLLPDILNALLIAWDSTHSPVRKAAVFCLVSLYMIIGENLRNHLTNLSSSKVKLLNVYINRAKEAKDQNIV